MEGYKWRLFFSVIVVMVGGTLLIIFSGSPATKDAVAHNKLCQSLKEVGSGEYENCQSALDTLIEQLLQSEELDLHECKGNKTTVYCPVKVWYVVRHLVITSPAVIQQVSHTDEDAVNRSKRETLVKKTHLKDLSNKCSLYECHELCCPNCCS